MDRSLGARPEGYDDFLRDLKQRIRGLRATRVTDAAEQRRIKERMWAMYLRSHPEARGEKNPLL
jgi:hypothetical protein